MGSEDSKYGLEHALGNTSIPRLLNPSIRGSVRRSDPDGGHTAPYFSTLTGKDLIIEVSPVVGDLTIPFSSDDMADAIAAINAASPANLQAEDDDGYLRVTNLNTGGKNKIVIKGGTATTLLGFLVSPEPGSTSYAGELAVSSSGRALTSNQNNPQGSSLVAANEDLTSSVINRAIFGGLRHIERIVRDLDIEIPIVKKIAVTVSTHVPTGKKIFVIQDDSLRFPIQGFGITGNPAPTASFDKLVSLRSSPNDLEIFDPLNAGGIPRVSAVYYNDGSNATADNTTNFTAWGTIDGKSIFTSQTKNKQAPATIASIRGNVLVVPTATFITNVCQPGDTAVIESADNDTPFNHNGEYVVVQVLSEKMLVVRAKSLHEATFVSTDKPTELNSNLPGGTTYGTVRVIVGATLPMSDLMFEVDSWVPNGAYFARVLCFRRVQDLQADELGEVLNPGNAGLGALLNTHFTGPNAHNATNINYGGGGAWADGTTNPATTVELQLDKIVADLAAITGAIKIGANTGPAWADATANPAATVEARLDKIITDLAGAAGSAKIQGVANGTDLAVGTVKAQLDDISTNWLKMARNNTITGFQTFTQLVVAQNGLEADYVETDNDVIVGAAVSVGTTIDANGNITSSGGHITSSGGHIKGVDVLHSGQFRRTHLPIAVQVSGGAYNVGIVSNAVRHQLDAGATVNIEITGLRRGDRLISVAFIGDSAAEPTVKQLYRQQVTGTLVPTTNTLTFVTNGGTRMTLNTPYTIDATEEIFVARLTAGAQPVNMWQMEVVYDHPTSV